MSSTRVSPAPAGRTRRFVSGWNRAGERAAQLFGIVLFALLYFVALAPVALLLKLTGKKLLPEFTGEESTFYLPKEPMEHTLEQARRQW
jgi:hypothetical protein